MKVLNDSAVFADRLGLSHVSKPPRATRAILWETFALDPRHSPVSDLSHTSCRACVSTVEGIRNLIACRSDVAALPRSY